MNLIFRQTFVFVFIFHIHYLLSCFIKSKRSYIYCFLLVHIFTDDNILSFTVLNKSGFKCIKNILSKHFSDKLCRRSLKTLRKCEKSHSILSSVGGIAKIVSATVNRAFSFFLLSCQNSKIDLISFESNSYISISSRIVLATVVFDFIIFKHVR